MLEETSCDYLGASSPVIDAALVTTEDRTSLVDLCYGIADACNLDLDTVAMAMGAVDRFLSRPGTVARDALRDRRQFRLVAVAALSFFGDLAAPGANVSVGDEVYTSDEIETTRAHIHRGLRGRVRAPTSLEIARRIFSRALCVDLEEEESRWGDVLDPVRLQTEYAVSDYYFTTQLPSTLAVAAVLNVFDEITGQDRQTLSHALLRVLPTVVSEHSLSPEDLLAAKERLRHVLEPEDSDLESEGPSNDATIVSETLNESLDQL